MRAVTLTRPTLLTVLALGLLAATPAEAGPARTKRLEPGTEAPSFKLRTPKTRYVHRLADFAHPGPARRNQTKRTVLLDFFRTDCKPCVESIPELVALHEAYAKKGLEVILVALLEQKDGRDKLERFLAKSKLPFLVLEDPTDYVAERYLGKTISLPATFLLDPDATIVKAKYDAKVDMKTAFGPDIERLLEAAAPAEKAP